MTSDLKLALRHLAGRKLFAASSALLLALGLGIAGILATIIRDVMVSPFPYRDSQRLVLLAQYLPARNAEVGSFNEFDVVEFGAANLSAFVGVGALEARPASLRRGDLSERVAHTAVTLSTFELLGVAPQLGRFFHPEETRLGAPPVAVLSHLAWTNRFARDPNIIGQAILLDDVAHTIVGVMPPRFAIWGAEVWTPLIPGAAPLPTAPCGPSVLASIREGFTLDQARAQLQGHFDAIAPKLPPNAEEYRGRRSQVLELMPLVLRSLQQTLVLLAVAVGLLLLLTTINLSSLTFLRLTAMRQELAVRVALGATRGHLITQVLAEISLIAVAGGALALLIVQAGVPAFLSVTPSTFIPAEAAVRVDAPVLLSVFGGAILLALLAAAGPLIAAFCGRQKHDLTNVARVHRGSRQTRQLESLIVVLEVALAFAIVLCTTTVALTFARKLQGDGGFTQGAVSTMRMLLPPDQRANADAQRAAIQRAETALQNLPGVAAASIAQYRPMIEVQTRSIVLPGRDAAAPESRVSVHYRAVSSGYLATTGMRLDQGRFIEQHDTAGSTLVGVVNQTFARAISPSRDVLGRTLVLPPRGGGAAASTTVTIVGIVADTLQAETQRVGPQPEIFVSLAQADVIPADLAVLVRSVDDTLPAAAKLMETLRQSVGEGVSFYSSQDFDSLYAQLLGQHRLGALILSVLGLVALVIAAVGLYSLLAYSLAQRMREMGIRQALGATPGGLVRLFCTRGLRLTTVGLVLGAAVFRLFVGQIDARVVGSTNFDPTAVGTSLITLLLVAAVASLIPGLRAARVDPIRALRAD